MLLIPSFITSRNIRLSYRRLGRGAPLLCVPGGPLLPADYLGDLGGLDRHVELVMVDLPGSDLATHYVDAAYRCDNVADDLEELRVHLGLYRIHLLGHSAGANIVLRYAERHPDRVGRLLLVAPSTRAVGIEIANDARSAVARMRVGEPWYAEASAALGRIQAGEAGADDWAAIAPFSYGRWDQATADYNARMDAAMNPIAAAAFGADGAFDPPATRAALSKLHVPVRMIAGSLDVGLPVGAMEELAELFPDADLVVQLGAGHFPWVDDPDAFVATASASLGQR